MSIVIRLNIGCASNMFPGWVNSDRVDMSSYLETLRASGEITGWPEHQQKIAAHARDGRVSCIVRDIRDGLGEYADGTVDAIYLGQVIEHWNPVYETPRFLAEMWRALRPGGRIRITTPDLGKLLKAYDCGKMDKFAAEQPEFYTTVTPDAQLAFLMFGACGPNCTRDNYEGHFMCYGRRAMRALLEAVGFFSVDFEVKSDAFAECVDVGESHSMFVEAVKP